MAAASLLAAPTPLQGPTPRLLRVEDSGRWETLVPTKQRLGLSPDGRVLAYRVDRSNWEDELRITRLSDGRTLVVPYGTDPVYSPNSEWLMYSIGRSFADEEQLRRERRPIRDGLGLLQLSTFTETRFAEVESADFSADGLYLAMERYPVRAAAGRAGGARRSADNDPTRLFVRPLGDPAAAEVAFDAVRQYEWQPRGGRWLALSLGDDADGNARVQLYDPAAASATAAMRIDASPSSFSQLSWRPDGRDLAYLRRRAEVPEAGPAFDLIVSTNAGSPERATRVYDATRDPGFPANERLVDYRALSWSSDGRTVFAGVAPATLEAPIDDTSADVRVWHWRDVEVMPRQVEGADAARRRNRLAAVTVETGRLVVLSPTLTSRALAIDGTALAWTADWTTTALARTLGRPVADLSLVDIRSGARSIFATGVDDNEVHVHPDGRALVFLRDDHLWSLDTTTRVLTDLSAASGAALVDRESDSTAAHKPLFGIGGFVTDGSVLAYDRYDIWKIAIDGRSSRKLTDGAATQSRYRLALLDGDSAIDPAQPLYLSVFGERTKQSGYARLAPGQPIERLLWVDKHVEGLAVAGKGANAVYAYVSQGFDDSPDIFIAGPSLADARAVTATNPQQADYAWGRSAVIDYTTSDGDALQAALYYPAGYVAGRRYPTIVKLYERLSDEVHDYESPSDMDEANIAVFTNLGYVVIAPDIRYRPRDPGRSTVACVTAAVARAVALGVTDATRVGVIGHSWGAYGSAYLATHTTGVFAAAVAGSPITDLISQYGNHHWGTGVAETDHIETGQQRMQVPYFEDPDAYVRNSPIFGVGRMTTPLLLEAGDADGEVFWHQSVELYNAARRAQKPVVLLQYPDEAHVLDDFENRRDYQRRILQWFGHFLKNETAPRWIVTGTPYVKR